jgi:hypothetical protein
MKNAERFLELHKKHPRAFTLVLVAYEALRERPGMTGQEFTAFARGDKDEGHARSAYRKAKLAMAGSAAPGKRVAVGA